MVAPSLPSAERYCPFTVPLHVPANGLTFCSFGVSFLADSVSFFLCGLDFSGGAAGVDTASSIIGAGSRCDVIKSVTKQSQTLITFIVDSFQVSAKNL
jgi:hypothetical protein